MKDTNELPIKTPDVETAKTEIELAAIAITHGTHPFVIKVTIQHLEQAIAALKTP